MMKAIGPHPGEREKGSALCTQWLPVTGTGSAGEVRSLCLLAFQQWMQEPPGKLCFTVSAPAAELLAGGKASAGECRAVAEDAAYKVLRVSFCLSCISFADDLASVGNKQAGKRTHHSTVSEKGALDLEPESAESF